LPPSPHLRGCGGAWNDRVVAIHIVFSRKGKTMEDGTTWQIWGEMQDNNENRHNVCDSWDLSLKLIQEGVSGPRIG